MDIGYGSHNVGEGPVGAEQSGTWLVLDLKVLKCAVPLLAKQQPESFASREDQCQ